MEDYVQQLTGKCAFVLCRFVVLLPMCCWAAWRWRGRIVCRSSRVSVVFLGVVGSPVVLPFAAWLPAALRAAHRVCVAKLLSKAVELQLLTWVRCNACLFCRGSLPRSRLQRRGQHRSRCKLERKHNMAVSMQGLAAQVFVAVQCRPGSKVASMPALQGGTPLPFLYTCQATATFPHFAFPFTSPFSRPWATLCWSCLGSTRGWWRWQQREPRRAKKRTAARRQAVEDAQRGDSGRAAVGDGLLQDCTHMQGHCLVL